MATISSLSPSLPFPKRSHPSSSSLKPNKPLRSFTIKANESDPPPEPEPPTPTSNDEDFDTRMNEFRLKYRSGTGKKAEMRKVKKSRKGYSSSSSSGSSGVYLPPVPLKEAVSWGGVKVDFGFSPYSERLNGRIAMLGLTALLLVELATGKGVINYHTPAIVLIQMYFVAAVAAVYVKYEKEKISVWPQSSRNE